MRTRPIPAQGWIIALALIGAIWTPLGLLGVDPGPVRGQVIDPRQSLCIAETAMVAQPQQVALGEPVSVSLRFRASCPPQNLPIHLVLVIEASSKTRGDINAAAKAAAQSLVDSLDLAGRPQIRIGIVSFATNARTLCPLTNQASRIASCIDEIDAEGAVAIDRGVQEGLKVLRQGRQAAQGPIIHEFMLVMSTGRNDEGCEPAEQAARSTKVQGALLMSACLGDNCDAHCLREICSSARYAFQLDDLEAVTEMVEEVVDDPLPVRLRVLTIRNRLAEGMPYLPGSAMPEPASNIDDILTWNPSPDTDGVTVTYRLQPEATGRWALADEVRAEFRDNQNRVGEVAIEVPVIEVIGASEPNALYLPWLGRNAGLAP